MVGVIVAAAAGFCVVFRYTTAPQENEGATATVNTWLCIDPTLALQPSFLGWLLTAAACLVPSASCAACLAHAPAVPPNCTFSRTHRCTTFLN